MNLQFHNTLSRQTEALRPPEAGRLGIYVCGPTVYAAPHLGHARSAVVFDVFRRFFEALGYDVTLVRNITDIDDKILIRARETGTDYRALANRYHHQYDAVMAALNVCPPHAAPRATDYIGPCQDIIARILQRGHAYRRRGAVYFSTHSCRGYGRLSRRSGPADRVHAASPENPDKRHPDDFALWKGRRADEPFWDSPWGPGRPGWHIECTAMGHALLSVPFAIHGGGRDLIFPHHENEIAQSLAAFGTPPAGLWLHHGMVTVDDVKMAKSKGNAPSLQGLLNEYHPEAVRLFLLARHYRRDLPLSKAALHGAANQLDRLYGLARRLQAALGDTAPPAGHRSPLWQQFSRCIAADGNIPGGLAALFSAVRELNRMLDRMATVGRGPHWEPMLAMAADFHDICRSILGVLEMTPEEYARDREGRTARREPLSSAEIRNLVARRQTARQSGDWSTADRLRARLEENGVRLRDEDHATAWRLGKQQGLVRVTEVFP